MDHSEWFQENLDIKASLTHSFNPETKPAALGKDYFCSTSVSALAPSSWRGKTWFYLEQQPGYSPTSISHRLCCQQSLQDNPWLLPRPQASHISPLAVPTLPLLSKPWAEARPGWWSQHRGLLLINLLPGQAAVPWGGPPSAPSHIFWEYWGATASQTCRQLQDYRSFKTVPIEWATFSLRLGQQNICVCVTGHKLRVLLCKHGFPREGKYKK